MDNFNQTGTNQPTNQTGGMGTPVQVENVQYNVQVGKMQSKVGLISHFFTLGAWAIAIVGAMVLTALRAQVFSHAGGVGEIIVFGISVLVPVVPIFWYARTRLNKVLQDNPAAIDDIFFKKSIRFHLVAATAVGVFWIVRFVYSLLSGVFLSSGSLDAGTVIDTLIFAALFTGLAFLFLQYQLKTKR